MRRGRRVRPRPDASEAPRAAPGGAPARTHPRGPRPPARPPAARLFGPLGATMDLAALYLGDRLGLYRALADGGPMTSGDLAARTGLVERYVREWLEHGALSDLLTGGGAPA